MKSYRNEIEQFIYEICYRPMWEAAYKFIYEHPYQLDLSFSRIKYPDVAILEDMLLEFTKNIRILDERLLFDAVVSCTINLSDNNRCSSCDLSQWLVISFDATITEKLESLIVTSIKSYSSNADKQNAGQPVSNNIVPIIYKEDLDTEATIFLEKYCPEALTTPMSLPIENIAKTMGLEIIQGHCITDDFSIFGQICFSEGEADVYDLFKCKQSKIPVRRGTILIDAYTFWERNLGCGKEISDV